MQFMEQLKPWCPLQPYGCFKQCLHGPSGYIWLQRVRCLTPWPCLQTYKIESSLEGSLGAFDSIDVAIWSTVRLQDPW